MALQSGLLQANIKTGPMVLASCLIQVSASPSQSGSTRTTGRHQHLPLRPRLHHRLLSLYTAYIQPIYSLFTAYTQRIHSLHTRCVSRLLQLFCVLRHLRTFAARFVFRANEHLQA